MPSPRHNVSKHRSLRGVIMRLHQSVKGMGLVIICAGLAACSSASKSSAPPPEKSSAAAAAASKVSEPPIKETASEAANKAKEKEAAMGADKKTVCAKGEDKRILEVAAKDEKGCEVTYTKSGVSKSIASAANGAEHCEKTVEKIRGKLEASGFKCD
jgi:hypothetical protein